MSSKSTKKTYHTAQHSTAQHSEREEEEEEEGM